MIKYFASSKDSSIFQLDVEELFVVNLHPGEKAFVVNFPEKFTNQIFYSWALFDTEEECKSNYENILNRNEQDKDIASKFKVVKLMV